MMTKKEKEKLEQKYQDSKTPFDKAVKQYVLLLHDLELLTKEIRNGLEVLKKNQSRYKK